MPKKLTQEEFIERAKQVHGDKYGYDKVQYYNSKQKVIITCFEHGDFPQPPKSHLKGQGCRDCSKIKMSKAEMKKVDDFIRDAREVHGNRYDYSKANYTGKDNKIIIKCLIHGEFNQSPHSHLNGRGCPLCWEERRSQARILGTECFITRAQEVHGDRYDYSKVNYIHNKRKIVIICKLHGEFEQSPRDHLYNKAGCPRCMWLSSGQKKIESFLEKYHIAFRTGKRFNKCKDKNTLPFDFYFVINRLQFLVEYDGIQHFEPIEIWGGIESLYGVQYRDAIKTQFAQDNGFILIRIPYTVKNIEAFLQFELEKHLSFPLDQLKSQPLRPQPKIQPINPYQWQQGVLL